MRTAKWVSAATGLVGLLVAAPSFAAATEGSLQIGLGFRYGVELNEGDFNPWGTGLGLEVGYTLPVLPIYVGGNAEYFFGGTLDSPAGKIDGNIWQLTAEGGYDFGLGDHLVLRPKLGLGFANLAAETCLGTLGCTKSNDNQGVIAPGAKLILMFSRFELSFDGRYDVVLSDPASKAFIFSVGIGF
jgi:Outer membrane protein beta-barrel domain